MFETTLPDRSLIDLDDLPMIVDEERCGQYEIAPAIEQVAIEDVVDASQIVRLATSVDNNHECAHAAQHGDL